MPTVEDFIVISDNDVYTRNEVLVLIPYVSSNLSKLLNLTEQSRPTKGMNMRYLSLPPIPRYLIPKLGPCSLKITYSAHTDLSVKFQSHRSRDYTNPMLPIASSIIDAIDNIITVSKFIDLESLTGVTKKEWRQVRHTFKNISTNLVYSEANIRFLELLVCKFLLQLLLIYFIFPWNNYLYDIKFYVMDCIFCI
uniref:Uncharacterized protein n=1 Tax=Lactuca sativa TaxID=4236 RepID=A0A9R1XB97_LACSA|nr:hypothetical protein LSAT_V11C500282960 [Lactuca sativa]